MFPAPALLGWGVEDATAWSCACTDGVPRDAWPRGPSVHSADVPRRPAMPWCQAWADTAGSTDTPQGEEALSFPAGPGHGPQAPGRHALLGRSDGPFLVRAGAGNHSVATQELAGDPLWTPSLGTHDQAHSRPHCGLVPQRRAPGPGLTPQGAPLPACWVATGMWSHLSEPQFPHL